MRTMNTMNTMDAMKRSFDLLKSIVFIVSIAAIVPAAGSFSD